MVQIKVFEKGKISKNFLNEILGTGFNEPQTNYDNNNFYYANAHPEEMRMRVHRTLDNLGGGYLLKRSMNIDSLGGGYLLKRNSSPTGNLDALGGGYLL